MTEGERRSDAVARGTVALAWIPAVLGGSGAYRYVTGRGLGEGLVVVAIALAPGLLWAVRGWSSSGRWRTVATWLSLGFPLAAVLAWALDAGPFGGLVTVGGGDAGNHILQQRAFVDGEPATYMGFVALYAWNHWLGVATGADAFETLRITFLATAAALSVLPVGLWVARGRGAAWFVPMALALNLVLLGPLLHYHQADGFFPHLVAAVIPVATWLVVGGASSPAARLAALAFGAVAYRFTYGLNLGDFLFAAACAAAWEASTALGGARRVWALAAAGFAVTAASSWVQVIPLFRVSDGAVLPSRFASLVPAMLAVPAVVLGVRRYLPGPAARWMVFPFAFLGSTLAVLGALRLAGVPFFYYAWKYIFHAEILAISLLVAAIPVGIAGVWEAHAGTVRVRWSRVVARWRSEPRFGATRLVAVAVAVAGALAVAGVALAVFLPAYRRAGGIPLRLVELWSSTLFVPAVVVFAAVYDRVRWRGIVWALLALGALAGIHASEVPYRTSYSDRLRSSPPWREVGPLSDRVADRLIEQVLAERGHHFGGLLTYPWPTSNFANALHGGRAGWGVYLDGQVGPHEGECVFWSAHPDLLDRMYALNPEKGFPVRSALQRLQTDARRECRDYTPTWSTRRSERLCWVCYGAEGAALEGRAKP